MKNQYYILEDQHGNYMNSFDTYSEAFDAKELAGKQGFICHIVSINN